MTYSSNIHLIVACIVLCCIHVLRFYLTFLHLKMQTFTLITQWTRLIVVVTCHDYIGHNNASLGFAIFLVVPHVILLLDNHGFVITTFI